MAGYIPDKIIDEINSRLDIAEIVSRYIPLKRSGRNYKALCPFHQEKTPSFMVSPQKGIFHCFGCGIGGNMFHFVMKYERLQFPEAIKLLAERAGVKIPEPSKADRISATLSSKIYKLNELTGNYYHELLKRSKTAEKARHYLKSRGLDSVVALKYRLGYAPASGKALVDYTTGKNIGLDILEKAGLVIRRTTAEARDRFINRIIFPIFDTRGRVVAFGGRVLDNHQPKYMNSPETEVYVKGKHLYGINLAKEFIIKENFCIIVEGYLDQLTPYKYGIRNIVASLGTALTEGQINLLRRYSQNVIMIFDSDKAGEMATLRSLDLIVQRGLQVKVVSLPKGYDPDSYLRKNGVENFRSLIKNASDLFDYKLNLLRQRHDINAVEGKIEIAREMLPTIHKVQNSIQKGEYIKRLAQAFNTDNFSLGEQWVLSELKKIKDTSFGSPEYQEIGTSLKEIWKDTQPAERFILGLMLENQDIISDVRKHIESDDFNHPSLKMAAEALYLMHANGEKINPNLLMNRLKDEESCAIVSKILTETEIIIDHDKCLKDCIIWMKKRRLKSKLNRLQDRIKVAQSDGKETELQKLILEYSRLLKTGD